MQIDGDTNVFYVVASGWVRGGRVVCTERVAIRMRMPNIYFGVEISLVLNPCPNLCIRPEPMPNQFGECQK